MNRRPVHLYLLYQSMQGKLPVAGFLHKNKENDLLVKRKEEWNLKASVTFFRIVKKTSRR